MYQSKSIRLRCPTIRQSFAAHEIICGYEPQSRDACPQGHFCSAVELRRRAERRVKAPAVKNCIAILPAGIKPRSENVCLHRHFCSAVECPHPHEVRKSVSLKILLQQDFMRVLNHEAKMCACTDIFARPSMSHRAAICRTGGAPPPILAIRQVSWEYYTTK